MADVQDVLIVGGGAAGSTAGLFAARDRRRALLRAESARHLVTATAALAAIQYLRDGRWAA